MQIFVCVGSRIGHLVIELKQRRIFTGLLRKPALNLVQMLDGSRLVFILDRLEDAGMVARRRDTEDRRRVWVEIVPEAQERLQGLQQPVAEEMRQVAQRFKAEELAIVRDFMREAKEVFERQVGGAAPFQKRRPEDH